MGSNRSLAGDIPILDCSKIEGDYESFTKGEGFQSFLTQLGDGMSGIGFVYLVNHGMDPSIVKEVNAKTRQFFQLPLEVKKTYSKKDPLEDFNGYTQADEERVGENNYSQGKDYKEAFDFWGSEMLKDVSYPREVPGLKEAITKFRLSLTPLCKKLFYCFARYLELEDLEFFNKQHKALEDLNILSHNVIRTNYYMPLDPEQVPSSEDALRLGEHNDWGSVTFLVQDEVGGLEAKMSSGDWIPVPPIEGSIVLNAGLMLEMWSGGHFPATWHRVRLLKPKASILRQSLGYFIQPDGNVNCVPVIDEKENWVPLYPKVDTETHWEYFKSRIRATRGASY